MKSNHAGTSVEDALSLAGRRVLITGGSLGIGRAIAVLMARRGAIVAVHHSSAVDAAMGYPNAAVELLDALRRELSERRESNESRESNEDSATAGVCAIDQPAKLDIDLMHPDSGRRVVHEAIAALGGIDIVVHAASVQVRESFSAVSADTIDRQVRIDFASTVELLQTSVAHMAARKSGRIIAIGSVNQVRPHPELMVYASLKAAQHNLIIGIAKQHAANGITANTLSPGLIATPRNDFRRHDMEEWARIQKGANPMGRAGTVDEVAQVAALLAAPAGAFITGADIAIDGGGRL